MHVSCRRSPILENAVTFFLKGGPTFLAYTRDCGLEVRYVAGGKGLIVPATKLNRMLALLRRYISAPEEERDPHRMIAEFKSADNEMSRSKVPSSPLEPEADRPATH